MEQGPLTGDATRDRLSGVVDGRNMNYSTAMVQLPLVRESVGESVRTPDDVVRICCDLRNLAQEAFQILTLNAKNRLLNRHLVSLGLADSSLVHPRESYRPALLDGAAMVVAVHNHPSSDPTPSAEDIRITRQLIEAGRILGIPLVDHIILGRNPDGTASRYSMRESGVCDFSPAIP